VFIEDDDDRHVDSKETISMSLAMKVDDSTQVRIKISMSLAMKVDDSTQVRIKLID
jgi:hypothetical protein